MQKLKTHPGAASIQRFFQHFAVVLVTLGLGYADRYFDTKLLTHLPKNIQKKFKQAIIFK